MNTFFVTLTIALSLKIDDWRRRALRSNRRHSRHINIQHLALKDLRVPRSIPQLPNSAITILNELSLGCPCLKASHRRGEAYRDHPPVGGGAQNGNVEL